jgi:LEA14-like dessication related protein
MRAISTLQIGIGELPPGGRVLARRSQRLVVVAICMLAGLSGCSTLSKHSETFRVTLSNIEVEEATLLEQLYTVTLRVQNGSEWPLGVRGGSFNLAINGRDFGSGVSNTHVDIPAFTDAQIQLRVVSTLFSVVRLIRGMQDGGGRPLEYEISGHIKIAGSYGRLSFREQGEIGLERPATGERAGSR